MPCKAILLKYLLPVLFLSASGCADAQFIDDAAVPLYRHIPQGKSGLPACPIYRAEADNDGYIWLAAAKGIFVYNGIFFKPVIIPGNDQEVTSMKRIGNKLICFTYSGNIISIDLLTRKAVQCYVANATGKEGVFFTDCVILSDRLCLLTAGGKAFWMPKNCFEGSSFLQASRETSISSLFDYLKKQLIPSPDTYAFLGGMQVEYNKNPHFVKINPPDLLLFNKIFITQKEGLHLMFDGDKVHKEKELIDGWARVGNDLWAGFFNGSGLVCYKDFFIKSEGRTAPEKIILPHVRVTNICRDPQNNIWISTYDDGIFIITPEMAASGFINTNDPKRFYSPDVKFISMYRDNLITGYNSAVADINYADKRIRFAGDTADSFNPVIAVLPSAEGRFYLISKYVAYDAFVHGDKGIAKKASSRWLTKDAYLQDDISYISSKNLYLKAPYNAVNNWQYSAAPGNSISIAPAEGGSMYFATPQGLLKDSRRIESIGNERITRVRHFGKLVLAAGTNGLFILRPDNNMLIHLTGRSGLPGSSCSQLEWDGNETFYVLTEAGVAAIDMQSLKVKGTYNADNLFEDITVNCFALYAGKILLGTNKGIVIKNIINGATAPEIPFHIISPDAAGHNYIADTGVYAYNSNLVVYLKAELLDYNGSNFKMSYSIEKDGEHFLSPLLLSDPQVALSRLQPGSYEITFEAAGDHVKRVKKYRLIILPQWWQKGGTRILILLAAIALLILAGHKIYRQRLRVAKQKIADQNSIFLLQNKAAFSQLKPHFIFNALNPLQSFIFKEKKQEALQYLEQFSFLMRGILNESTAQSISLEDEIRFINAYIDIQKQRFSRPIRLYTHIAEGLGPAQVLIPPMLLQPLVENAIEHGLKDIAAPPEISISISPVDKLKRELLITVEDNGCGLSDDNIVFLPGHALDILMQRMRALSKLTGAGSITIRNRQDNITGVICELRVIYEQI